MLYFLDKKSHIYKINQSDDLNKKKRCRENQFPRHISHFTIIFLPKKPFPLSFFSFSLLRLKITFFSSSSSFPSFHSQPEIPSIIFPNMGRYIKKSKIAGGALPAKDISHQTASSFRTRAAKNLALQRLRSHSTPPCVDADSFRYLQLRSRRLVKLPLLADTRKQQQKQLINSVGKRQTTNPRANSVLSSEPTNLEEDCGSNLVNSGSGCSFGEKGLEFESGDR